MLTKTPPTSRGRSLRRVVNWGKATTIRSMQEAIHYRLHKAPIFTLCTQMTWMRLPILHRYLRILKTDSRPPRFHLVPINLLPDLQRRLCILQHLAYITVTPLWRFQGYRLAGHRETSHFPTLQVMAVARADVSRPHLGLREHRIP